MGDLRRLLGENAKDIVLAQHLVSGAVDLDFSAAVLADEHAVADFEMVDKDDKGKKK